MNKPSLAEKPVRNEKTAALTEVARVAATVPPGTDIPPQSTLGQAIVGATRKAIDAGATDAELAAARAGQIEAGPEKDPKEVDKQISTVIDSIAKLTTQIGRANAAAEKAREKGDTETVANATQLADTMRDRLEQSRRQLSALQGAAGGQDLGADDQANLTGADGRGSELGSALAAGRGDDLVPRSDASGGAVGGAAAVPVPAGNAGGAGAVDDGDYLAKLFGEQQAATATVGPKKESIIAALAEAKQTAMTQRDDWSGRKYASNRAQVELPGDGPSNRGSLSIGSINEGRRRKAVEALNQEIAAIEGIEKALVDEAGSARLMGLIEHARENAAHDAARDGRPEQAGEYFERGILDALGIRPAQGAYASNAVSKALRKVLEAPPAGSLPANPQETRSVPAGKPARQTREQAAKARKQAYREANPFKSFLAEYGINTADRADAGGDPHRPVLVPYHGALFRGTGMRLDELARRAVEHGFLTQADIDSPMDNGGVNKLSDMIRRMLAGEQIRPVAAAASAEEQEWEAQAQARYDAMADAEQAIVDEASDDQINALMQEVADEDQTIAEEEAGAIADLAGEADEGAAGTEAGGDLRGGTEAWAENTAEVDEDADIPFGKEGEAATDDDFLASPTPDDVRRQVTLAEQEAAGERTETEDEKRARLDLEREAAEQVGFLQPPASGTGQRHERRSVRRADRRRRAGAARAPGGTRGERFDHRRSRSRATDLRRRDLAHLAVLPDSRPSPSRCATQ